MLKSDKEQMIADLNGRFSKVKAIVVAEFNKLNVDTVTKLRKKLRDGGVEYKVLKNTLAKRAAKGTDVEQISGDFTGPVAVLMSYTDVIAPAKILVDFTKDMESIKVKSAVIEGKKIDVNGVKALAKLPGLNELRGMLLGVINQPATKLARTIKEPSGALVRVIQAKSTQSE